MDSRIQITVLSAGSAQPALDVVAPAFEWQTGHAVRMVYNVGRRSLARRDAGKIFDVVIHTDDALEKTFRPGGRVEKGGGVIGRVGMGAMVRPDARRSDHSASVKYSG